jgi:hypothetical protein
MWPPMTLLILLLLSPCSLPSAYGAGSLPPGERVSALAATIVADQGMILAANDQDDLAPDAGEESTDDELGPPSHLASRVAHEFWRAIRASHARWMSAIGVLQERIGKPDGAVNFHLEVGGKAPDSPSTRVAASQISALTESASDGAPAADASLIDSENILNPRTPFAPPVGRGPSRD